MIYNNQSIMASLICSALALDSDGHLLFKDYLPEEKVYYKHLRFQSLNLTLSYLSEFCSQQSILQLTSELLQDISLSNFRDRNSQKIHPKTTRVRQYLRKFNFFYRYYVNSYPNNLKTASNKKINMLAIKSLFLISSL